MALSPEVFSSNGRPDLSVAQPEAEVVQATPNPMEASLCEAVRAYENHLANRAYTFPYPKLVDGVRHWVHFRRNNRYGELFFSIDVGVFSDDKTHFKSRAFVDFSIGMLSGVAEEPVGIVGCSHEKPLFGPILVKRPDSEITDYAAIFVQEALRRNGLARDLKDGAITVLEAQPIGDDGKTVNHLVFDGIVDLRPETPTGEFFGNISGDIVRTYADSQGRQRGRMVMPIVSGSTSRIRF
jgi:hypothetical protein